MSVKTRATIEDLYKVEGKAELMNGEIVLTSPTGGIPGRAGRDHLCQLASARETTGPWVCVP
jgi:hypothetical protein